MTGRAAEVRAMTKRRGESIPPPPRDTAAPMGEGQTVDAPPPPNPAVGEGNPSAVTYIQPHPAGATQPSGSALANRSSRPEPPTLDRLFHDVIAASRDMAYYREAMPVRALNVNVTAGVRAAFERHCKDLRVNMKDVVEMLLRGWLTSEGVDVQDIWPDR